MTLFDRTSFSVHSYEYYQYSPAYDGQLHTHSYVPQTEIGYSYIKLSVHNDM